MLEFLIESLVIISFCHMYKVLLQNIFVLAGHPLATLNK